MAKFANTTVLDGGSDLIRTLAGTAARVKMHLIKAYTAGDAYATVVTTNGLGSIDMVAADFVQSTATSNRVTTVAAKTITLTASSLQYDQGTATSGTATTLADTSKAWTVNAWATRAVRITGGTGSGQTRVIASNTATVLTVGVAWTTNPDATSAYKIVDDLNIAVVDSTGTAVLLVTDETSDQIVTSGGTFSVPSWSYTVSQPV